ncbi:TOBE domain-containing protein, partial [Frankia sp. AiPs1]|uniref:TOBE domain-containing protein n=1 Tax=Frankia sp. AiPs1 TaxID=573493 RepID=UPI0020433916
SGPVLLGWRPADGLLEPVDAAGDGPVPGGPVHGGGGPGVDGTDVAVPAGPGVVLRGVADVVEFTGDGTVVTCVSPGEDAPWAVSIRGRDRVPAVGDAVRVRVQAEHVHLFDPDGGLRLGATTGEPAAAAK